VKKKIRNHKDLDVWKKSIDLVEEIYSVTKKYPKEEMYGLTNQLRRSSISITSNISEVAARNSRKEFIHFLYIAMGSASELESQLIISERLNYISKLSDLLERVDAIKNMLKGLISYLTKKDA
jgi:four helix bundle protein